MKKFLPIIIGVFTGVVVSGLLIVNSERDVAFGEDESNWWNSFVASADQDWFDWEDVFSPFGPSEKGKGLYNLMYKKLNRTSEKTALKEVAQKYSLTTDEAQAVVDGSISPIINNVRKGGNMTQEDAYKIVNKLQTDFVEIKELYQIEQEVDVAVAPGEIFANGDLSDSGFDLVQDLSKIEEILFVQKTENTVGAIYDDAYESPYKPTEIDATIADFIVSETPGAVLTIPGDDGSLLDLGGLEDVVDEGEAFGEIFGSEDAGLVLEEAEILASDICKIENSVDIALSFVESQNSGGGNGGGDGDGEDGDGGGDDDNNDGDGDGNGDGDADGDSSDGDSDSDFDKELNPAPTGNWNKVWCPGSDDPEVATFAGIGASGFESLSGAAPILAVGGAAAGFNSSVISGKVALCFDVQMIKKEISTFQPGDSCIMCEVEKINESMSKTLSHTLIPNKATGNLLEAAKCKEAASVPLLNLQFVTIWNPVPTPENDEVIFGRNIFEEWNSFAKRYQPVLLNKIQFESGERPEQSQEFILELEKMSAPANLTQAELFARVKDTQAKYKTEAALEVESFEVGDELANSAVYSQNVLDEMKQMNALFANFKNMFGKMDKEALDNIVTKPNID